jgi:hypothetical protein
MGDSTYRHSELTFNLNVYGKKGSITIKLTCRYGVSGMAVSCHAWLGLVF